MSEARNRLEVWYTHTRIAMGMARLEFPEGPIELAVTGKNSDGGRITASFEAEPFMRDLAEVLGFDVEDDEAEDP